VAARRQSRGSGRAADGPSRKGRAVTRAQPFDRAWRARVAQLAIDARGEDQVELLERRLAERCVHGRVIERAGNFVSVREAAEGERLVEADLELLGRRTAAALDLRASRGLR